MNRLHLILLSILLIACKQPPAAQPNIILIMGDDMGFSDIGCYGSEIKTPNLDWLAENGIRFTQFYNAARCCPTRASLLTGLYPQQAGIGHMVSSRGTPSYQGDLNHQSVTIAEVLKQAGYATYMSGKWHITPYVIDNPDKTNWPRQRGFDRFYGMISGAGSFYDPRSLTEENQYVAPPPDFYATTNFTSKAIEYIRQHQTNSPYFLYLAYTSAHWPLQAPEDQAAKYRGAYDVGWDQIRAKRFKRLQEMSLIDPRWELTNRDPAINAWTEDIPDREWEIANMEVYAAMIDIMDQGIGQIIEVLKERGELENTIIIFLQDNGACAEELDWVQPFNENGQALPANIPQTKMIPHFTRDGKPVKLMRDGWPGPPDGYTAYGLNWANASNTPFREYKHWVHEGGIATPLIVHWPEKVKEAGGIEHTPAHLIDIMATLVDAANATYPVAFNGHHTIPMEGKSLMPLFQELAIESRPLFWEHEGNRAVRYGKWKLISKADKANSFIWDQMEVLPKEAWELFDMEKDRTETINIADDHPEVVTELSGMWTVWANRAGAIPRPD